MIRLVAWGYLAMAVAAAITIWGFGDRSVLPTTLLYGPRWVLLVPAAPLALLGLMVMPKLLGPVTLSALLILGPVMGGRTGWRGWFAAGRGDLRVVTFNLDASQNPIIPQVPAALAVLQPDIIVVQECSDEFVNAAGSLPGWLARRDGSLCLMTRFRVDSAEEMETVRTRDQGGTGNAVRYRLDSPQGALTVVNVHLETPGKGLAPLRYGGSSSELTLNILVRDAGSSRTRRWALADGQDLLVAGDFNLVVESAIYRDHWSGCTNAFSRVGRGFGYTRVLKRFSARIDHVLSCGTGWKPVRAVVGPDLGSDHRPMVVDLRRRGRWEAR
ncbi:MAG: endonuclease/exonuclease/phosphatase family protein [Gemmatimonadota bacterium]